MKKTGNFRKSTAGRLVKGLFLLVLLAGVGHLRAQDLGVVWSKTYGPGNIRNIKPNPNDGGYVACGQPWTPASPENGNDRLYGLIIEFDESGNEIRRATVKIPQSYITGRTVTRAKAVFSVAFKTVDGGYFAAGTLSNIDAIASEKGPNWGAPHENLKNGTWLVKLDANLNVRLDTIVRGISITDGYRMEDGNFLIGGCDNATQLLLLRKYDQNGGLLIDRNTSTYREIVSIYKYPGTDEYIASTPSQQFRISTGNLNPSSITATMSGGNPYTTSITPGPGNGFFLNYYLSLSTDNEISYTNGNRLAKYAADNPTAVYYKELIPADTLFLAPLLLPGATDKYVGTAQVLGGSSAIVTGNYMYELTDNGSTYTCRTGASYPNNTALKTVSQTDGFLSCGTTDAAGAGLAAIAKLSTCANLKLNVGATAENLIVQSGSAHFPGRTVTHTGQIGAVTYSWTLTDVTPGGPAVAGLGTTSGSSNIIPARTFTLSAGKTSAVLRYAITATDTYSGGTCQQSQAIMVQIRQMPDNVSDADCYITPPASTWNIEARATSNASVYYLATPFAGDLDGDGRLEVVVPGVGIGGNGQPASSILIFDDQLQLKRTISTPVMPEYGTMTFLIADVDNDGQGEIVVATTARTLVCYAHDGSTKWTSNGTYTTDDIYYCPSLAVADINGDGYAEILAVNKIFDAATGRVLVTLPAGGRGFAAGGPPSYMPVFADVDNDGIQEVVAGNTVYRISITNRNDETGNSATILAQITQPDGFTSVADIDLDGDLDVIVTGATAAASANSVIMYVWDGATAQQIGNTVTLSSTGSRISRPFAGDITGNGRSEIAFTYYLAIAAYAYNSGTNTFQLLWKKTTTDYSGATTMSMFDFNQDGEVELVYRDETHLRIIDKNGENRTTFACTSLTHTEYPIVVDLDRDGHADILVSGGPASDTRIYRYGSDSWAPARSVWNQHAYNVVNINEDLTVPRVPLSPATVFPGPDGDLNTTGDNVRPFNNFLQQQTSLSKNGTPLWLTPDVKIYGAPTFIYNAAGDTLRIKFRMENSGDAVLQAPFYVTAYKNTRAAANKLVTLTVTTPLSAHSISGEYTLVIPNFSAITGLTGILLYPNDNGTAAYIQKECSYISNSSDSVATTRIMKAINDVASTPVNTAVKVAVKANDHFPTTACASSATPFITVAPSKGNASIAGDSIRYTPNSNTFGVDSLVYRIACSGDTAYARLYVVVNKPLAMQYVACPGAVVTMGFAKITGVTYDWYNDNSGAVGTLRKSASDTVMVTKTGAPVQTFWVRTKYAGTESPAIRVDLETSANCGNTTPTGCAATGTVIWKEDFGGNNPGDPRRAADPGWTGAKTTYAYTTRDSLWLPGPNEYALLKSIDSIAPDGRPYKPKHTHFSLDDHTSQGDSTTGYFLTFDADSTQGQFFEFEINSLCPGSNLIFSAWLMNINPSTYTGLSSPNYRYPDVAFIIEDMSGNVLRAFYTGNIPVTVDPDWLNYAFDFTVPAGMDTVKVRFMNNQQRGGSTTGNDISIDDIEVRFCTPEVNLLQPAKTDTTVFAGSPFTFKASYSDTPSTFGNSLEYRWERNVTGDLNNPAAWAIITGTQGTSTAGNITSTYTINPVALSDSGYYRLAVANAANINSYNCRAMSDIIHLRVIQAAANPDNATVQEYQYVLIDVLANDVLPASTFTASFSLLDSVILHPKNGDLSVIGSGSGSKLLYTNSHGAAGLVSNIDSFRYRFTVRDASVAGHRTSVATVYIYILGDRNGAAVCSGQSHTVSLQVNPAGTVFHWFTEAGAADGTASTRTFPSVTGDVTRLIQPVVPGATQPWNLSGGFPPGQFTVRVVNKDGAAQMRWTGLTDMNWHNPHNWVDVKTSGGQTYEAPVAWAPASCVDVVIPSGTARYPELTASGAARNIRLADRAMLKNPHALTYSQAQVEIKLKPAERDRFVMWSAPLRDMYSGDYHFKNGSNPQWGDVYMNYFQQANPAGGMAEANTFTATFGAVNESLGLGKAFNLHVTSTSQSKERTWVFPQPDNSYTDLNGSIHILNRTDRYKFITHGVTLSASDTTFALPLQPNAGMTLVQVVNPYLAYLDMGKFLQKNDGTLAPGGYLIWDGDVKSSFIGVAVTPGNRYLYTAAPFSTQPNLISPLQSFFVQKLNPAANLASVKMSPNWTTTAGDHPFTLRASEPEYGVLRIRAVQGDRTGHALLYYDPEAAGEYRAEEDVQSLFYDEIPLTLYSLTTQKQPLAVNSSGDFDSQPVSLGLRVKESGETRLEFSGLEHFGHNVYLIDREKNVTIDLQATPSYTFVLSKPAGSGTAEINSRFVLQMKYTGSGWVGNRPAATANGLLVSGRDGELHVRASSGTIGELYVYNVAGALVYISRTPSDAFRIPVDRRQVYVVKAKIDGTFHIQKALVK
jgi:hypothetical protein